MIEETPIQPGTVIDHRYRVERQLKQSTLGAMYVATDTQLGRAVVIKFASAVRAADEQARQQWLQEAHYAATLTHGATVRTYAVGDGVHGPFMVQEFVDGYALHKDAPLGTQRTLEVALAVTNALEDTHARGYVHGAIKPSNIMVATDENGRERIVLLNHGVGHANTITNTPLRSTPAYTAPEQSNAPPSGSSDLYALGVTLFFFLNGHLPVGGSASAPPSTALGSAALLQPIIEQLTATDPQARPLSAAQVHADLQKVWSRVVGTQALVAPPAAQRYAARRRWLVALPVALIGLCVALALVYGRAAQDPVVAQAQTEPTATVDAAGNVAVPNIVGVPLDDALRQLEQAGLAGAVRATVPSDEPPGTVVGTQPANGEPLAPGEQVTILTSSGPDTGEDPAPVAVPDIAGLSLDEARRALERVGLAFVTGDAILSDRPAGTVVATVPGAGQPLERGMPVVVHGSAGPAPTGVPLVPVPDVRGLRSDAACRQIQRAALVCVIDVPVSSNQPAGTIVSVLPTPGQRLPQGTRVVLHPSTGPATTTPPPTPAPNRPTAAPPTPVPTRGPAPPTRTPRPVPPTNTPVPPTDTPVPPTDTPVPVPTDTPVPPTDTPVPYPPPVPTEPPIPTEPPPVPTEPPPIPTEPPPVPTEPPPLPTEPPPLPTEPPVPTEPPIPTEPPPVPTDPPPPTEPPVP